MTRGRALTQEQRAEIERRVAQLESFDTLAEEYGVPRETISRLSMAGLMSGRIVIAPADKQV